MTYNMTNVSNADNVFEMFKAVNNVSGDWVARLFLIGLFLVIFLVVVWNYGEAIKAMISAGFVTMMIGGLFYTLNLVDGVAVFFAFTIFTVAIIILFIGGLKKNV